MEAEADPLNLAPDDALSVLEYWQASAARLMFVYQRSDGVFTQTGRGRIQQASPDMLTFATLDGQLEILVCDAAFEFGTLPSFATRHARVADADGLLVCLQNEDRLYLCAADSG
jgi:hypothetical protein